MTSTPEGYTGSKLLQRTERSEVFEAVRSADGVEVILKRYLADRCSDPRSRGRREFEALRRLSIAGVPRALAFERGEEPPTLVTQRIDAPSLARILATGPLALDAWLDLALRLSEIVAGIHAARMVHKDLTPGNVLLARDFREVWICDFGLAAELGEAVAVSGALEGTLLYIAPEQTGRMNRGCDMRTDLYSLGATLYHAAVGRPPFESSDPLELIHAHMARVPEAPERRRADFPEVLSRILLKLLRKEPAERYQSARALHADLDLCHEARARTGEIPASLELGASEVRGAPRFGTRLHGREEQIRILLDLYARSAAGRSEKLWIRGDPGTGKSTLIDALRPVLAETSGYLASASFEPDRDRPYLGWVVAVTSLAQQMLLESDARVELWRAQLRASLGNIAGVLVELVPDLGFVLGDVPAAPVLGPSEARARISLAFQRFIGTCATPEHPLVIFLDDLQWSDAASRGLLEELLATLDDAALLVVGACRSGEDDAALPIARTLERLAAGGSPGERLELGPLDPAAAQAMLAEALERPLAEVRDLAELVERKTGNNPLLIRQFVEHLAERRLLEHRQGHGFCWEPSAVAAADIPDGAVALMVAKISRLTPGTRELIEHASCVGDEFDVDLLAELSPLERGRIEQNLHALSDAGLIAPCANGFRFVHGGIRDAARSLLAEDARSSLHYGMAKLLISRTPPAQREARVFGIVEHLNRGLDHLSEDLRLVAIELNLAAGKRALASGAGATAEGYFAIARGLFREEDWQQRRAMGFELLLASATSALLRRDFAGALALLDELDRRNPSLLEATEVAIKRIQVLALTLSAEESASYALGMLRKFGVRWPLRPAPWRARLALRMVRWRMQLSRQGNLVRPAASKDPQRLAPILLMGIAGGVMARVDFYLGVLASCWVVSSNLRHGFVARPSYTLAVYAGSLQMVLHDGRWAQRIVKLAEEWNERVPDAVYGPRTRLQIQALLRPWWMARRAALAPLDQVAESMREVGDVEYARYTQFLKLVYSALAGNEVAATAQALLEMADNVRRWAHRYPEPERCHQAYRWLVEEAPSLDAEVAQSDAWFEANRGSAESYTRTLWLMVLCTYGRYDLAFAQSERLGSRLFKVVPYVHVADHTFYRGLAAAALALAQHGQPRRRHARELARSRRLLRRWARSGPDFVHMLTLLDAEHARLRGNPARARALYEESARAARKQAFVHHAALAHERRAQTLLHERRETEAAAALRDAIALYESWGALPKVRSLEQLQRTLVGG